MNPALQKTLSFILLIVIGLLLKQKIPKKDQLGGIKSLILSIALPATIFIALLKVKVDPALLSLPLMALAFNLTMFFSARYVMAWMGYAPGSPQLRTLMMLMPSLAPGLSCFPFIIEYLGEESLAWAALADVGNKIFGLILLYLVAMHWYQKLYAQQGESSSSQSRLKGLLLSLAKEPVNLVIVTALLFLAVGWNLETLPLFIQDAVKRMSVLMTPMILIFIGLAVKVKWKEVKMIFNLLFWRAGMAMCLAALVLYTVPLPSTAAALVLVVFPLSSCSFWPFAHMCAVEELESKNSDEALAKTGRTFDTHFALNILAFSLPFSTTLILTLLSFGDFFAQPTSVGILGLSFLAICVVPVLYRKSQSSSFESPTVVSPTVKEIEPTPASQGA